MFQGGTPSPGKGYPLGTRYFCFFPPLRAACGSIRSTDGGWLSTDGGWRLTDAGWPMTIGSY